MLWLTERYADVIVCLLPAVSLLGHGCDSENQRELQKQVSEDVMSTDCRPNNCHKL